MKITASRDGYAVSCTISEKVQDSALQRLKRMLSDDLDLHELHNKRKLSGAETTFTYTET